MRQRIIVKRTMPVVCYDYAKKRSSFWGGNEKKVVYLPIISNDLSAGKRVLPVATAKINNQNPP